MPVANRDGADDHSLAYWNEDQRNNIEEATEAWLLTVDAREFNNIHDIVEQLVSTRPWGNCGFEAIAIGMHENGVEPYSMWSRRQIIRSMRVIRYRVHTHLRKYIKSFTGESETRTMLNLCTWMLSSLNPANKSLLTPPLPSAHRRGRN